MKIILLLILCSFLSLGGCSALPSFEKYTQSWVGHSIEQKKKASAYPHAYGKGWKETTYTLDNGNWVYVEKHKPDCFIHWEVDPQGFIVGYKLVGKCP